jgi:hypothetical protein
MNNSEFQAHTEKVEQSLEQVNALSDDQARAAALNLMQALMDLHGASLSRVVEVLSATGDAGRAALSKVANDPLVCGLLVLYGIHPASLQERVMQAIEQLRPQVRKVGMNIQLASASESAVRIHVESSRPDEHSAESVRSMIERAIREAAPEVAEITIEGVPLQGFVPLSMIQPALKIGTGEAI